MCIDFLFWVVCNSVFILFYRRRKEAFLYASLSSVCRSNGVLNLGFIFIFGLRDAVVHLRKNESQGSYKFLLSVILNSGICAAGLIPFLGFQVWIAALKMFCIKYIFAENIFAVFASQIFCYRRFCHEEYVYPAKIPDFCIGSSPQLPYQYIQSHNWNVGFLKYAFILLRHRLICEFHELGSVMRETFATFFIQVLWVKAVAKFSSCWAGTINVGVPVLPKTDEICKFYL